MQVFMQLYLEHLGWIEFARFLDMEACQFVLEILLANGAHAICVAGVAL